MPWSLFSIVRCANRHSLQKELEQLRLQEEQRALERKAQQKQLAAIGLFFASVLLFVLAAVGGATIGRSLSKRMDSRGVDILFMCMLVGITAISLYNAVRFGAAL